MEVGKLMYRAVDADLMPTISTFTIDSYEIVKVTRCGVWLKYASPTSVHKRWRKVTGDLADWAQPTQFLALKSYAARKQRQVVIYEHKLFEAQARLREAQLCIRERKVPGELR